MPEQIRCPSCQSALRVPETLVGQNVKCPKCATTFLAEIEELAQEEESPRQPMRSAQRPSRQGYTREEEDEEEERPRRRRRRRGANAESVVAAPAIALLVVGGVGILGGLLNVIYFLKGSGLGPNPSDAYRFGSALGAFVSVLWAILIVSGALKMKQLENHGSAVAACIVAMIPCNLCCFLGIPIGIWGLIVLNNPDIKRAFS